MDPEEIAARARALGLDVTVNAGRPYLREDVASDPDREEPHDTAWARYCVIQAALGEVGLELADPYLEHDSITGTVRPEAGRAP